MFEKEGVAVELPASLVSFIDEWRNKPGNLIMVLHRVQEEYGYIPREVALELSRMMDVPLAKIYGVVTFYHFFKLKKPGKYMVSVCMGTACYLKGGEDIILEFERLLGLPVNGTTADGEFSLQAVRCIGCCGLAPVITINGEVFGKLTKDMLPGVVAKFKGK
jgi:NADH-quinone oxidoreductase subunit E